MRYSIEGKILADIADAINAKTGGTAALAPGDMADEIDSISGGGVTVEPLTATENRTYTSPSGKAYSPVTVAVPLEIGILSIGNNINSIMNAREISPRVAKLTIHNTNANAVQAANSCASLKGVDEIVITVDNGITGMNGAFEYCEASHITINADTSACTTYKNAFHGRLEYTFHTVVDGNPLDLSGVIAADAQSGMVGVHVTDIRFVPSSCKYSWNNSQCWNISDATLVSMANALDGTATGQTLTLHATPKATCHTLMGTVVDGLFTADASGTVTLADFITQTKGWTLA